MSEVRSSNFFGKFKSNMAVVLKQVSVSLLLSYGFARFFTGAWVLIWTAVVSFIVIFGSFNSCWVESPGKNATTGEIPFIRVLIFLPYYCAVCFLMIGGRLISLINSWKPVDEIIPGVYLGDFYSSFMSTTKWVGIVDVTNELPRICRSKSYLNIPAWDGCPPTVESIKNAVNFVSTCEKPVLIHCAYVNPCIFCP